MTVLVNDRADLLVFNGFVYTVDPERPHAEALATRNGRISAIGSSAELKRMSRTGTRWIDLEGRMVMPGLIDGHSHPAKGAMADLFSCKFEFAATPDEIAGAVTEYLARHPDSQWVIGGRWDSGFFERHDLPSPRAWLDQVSKGKPVYLRDDTGHNGWANTGALQILGVHRDSEDPAGGTIVRDGATRVPNGLLLEEADTMARSQLPDWSDEHYRAGVLEMVRIANAYGITGVVDADASEALLKAYQSVDRGGALSLRVAASISTPYGHREKPLNYAHLEALRDRYASNRVDTRFAKIYQDGVPTAARTAAMLAPYVADERFPDGFSGHLHVEEATLAKDIGELEKRGFTVKLHTAGDRAVHTTLNAIEKAHALSGRSDLRHELAHAGFIDPADLPRFKHLNVVADLSPYLWYPSPIVQSIRSAIGERGERYWPIRDLLEAGAPLLAGSDWPAGVSSMDPWVGIAAMVTRCDPSAASPGTLWPEQAIKLEQALKIFTLDGARALRREDETGSLKVGKSADLIVLERNLFDIEADRIADPGVEMTLVGGTVVYQKPLAGGWPGGPVRDAAASVHAGGRGPP